MLRRKIAIGLTAVCITAIVVSGCGGSKGDNLSKSDGVSEGFETESTSNEEEKLNNTDVKILAQDSNVGNIVSTDEGMYRIVCEELADNTWAQRIYYIDYASAREIVLCNDSSCNHDTENCSGVIKDDNLISPKLFVFQNKLYVFSSYDVSGSSDMVLEESDIYNVTTPSSCLYQMNLDGTNRKHILDFPDDISIDEMVFEWNGQLVFCKKEIKDMKSDDGQVQHIGVDRKLISLDPDTGELTELTDFPQELSVFGTYKNKLVCQRTIYPEGYTEEDTLEMETDEWRELIGKSQAMYLLFDFETGEETEICKLSGQEYFNDCMVVEGKMYLANGTPKVTCIDIESGQASEITMPDNRSYSLVQNLGDRIYCWTEGQPVKTYFWDPKENEISSADISMKGTDLADILAFNSEVIVVVREGNYKKSADGSYEIYSQTYGIMKKEELYKGNANCTLVSMCSDGMNE